MNVESSEFQLSKVEKSLDSISRGHNVSLHLVLHLVGRIARSHHTLIECALSTVAVVATNAENDCTFLAHWVVACYSRTLTIVKIAQGARGSIATTDGPVVRLALDNGGDEAVSDRGVIGIAVWGRAGEKAIFQVGHNPRTASTPLTPEGAVTEVNGFHVSVAIVIVVRLGIAVIEATLIVVVGAIEHSIHALWRVTGSDTRGIVIAISHARLNVDAVDLIAIQCDRRSICNSRQIEAVGTCT